MRALGIELLPPEIQRHILQHTPDIQTLRALMHASPRIFQVYLESKVAILSRVLHNQIPPSALSVAVKIFQWRELIGPSHSRQAVADSLGELIRNQTPPKSLELSLENLRALLQLDEVVQQLVSDFAENRITLGNERLLVANLKSPSQAGQIAEGEPPTFFYSLSKTEYARISRGFYYIELYRNVAVHSRSNAENLPLPPSLFLPFLRDWELEELLCVRNYLKEKLRIYLDQVEDGWVERSGSSEIEQITELHGPPRYGWENEEWFFSSNSIVYRKEDWLEGCFSRGLKTVSKMLKANTFEDRIRVLGTREVPTPRLKQSLKAMPFIDNIPRTISAADCDEDIGLEDAEQPNMWWCSAAKTGHPRNIINIGESVFLEGVRRGGCMMWDKKRLQDLGLLTDSYVSSLHTSLHLWQLTSRSGYHVYLTALNSSHQPGGII